MKISKNFRLYAIVWAILVAVFNVLVFATPSEYNGESKFTGTFWIGYTLSMLGFAGQLVCAYVGLGNENLKKVFYNIPLLRVSSIGLIVSVITGSIFMAIPTAQPWIAGIISVIILAVVAIATIKAKSAGDIVSGIDEKIKTQTYFIKNLTVDAESLMTRANTPESKAITKKVYESIRFSDPMSNDNLSDIEGRINYEFKTFETAIKSGDMVVANSQAEELLALIENRNNKCKALK